MVGDESVDNGRLDGHRRAAPTARPLHHPTGGEGRVQGGFPASQRLRRALRRALLRPLPREGAGTKPTGPRA